MGIFDVAKKILDKPATPTEIIEALGRYDYQFVYKNFEVFKSTEISKNPEAKVWFLINMLKKYCQENNAEALFEIGKYGMEYMSEQDLIVNMEGNDGLNCMIEFVNQTTIAAYTLKKYDECLKFHDFYCGGRLVPQTLGHAIVLMSIYERQTDKDLEMRDFTKLGQELFDVYTHEDFLTRLDKKTENECVIAFYDVPRTLATMYMKHQVASALDPDKAFFPLLLSLTVFAKAKEKLTEDTPGFDKISKMIDEAIEVLKLEIGDY